MPEISPDGRTYTFRIRPGFRFSPPSGQAVTAETFRATIERALSPKLATGGHPNDVAAILPDVVGAAAYAAGRAPHISGITARGDTLTIRLTRAAGDLSARLRTSFFCPVPIGTPAVPGGGKTTPIPMAGPYYVASAGGGQVVRGAEPELHRRPPAPHRAHRLHRWRQRGRRHLARRTRARRLRQREHRDARPGRTARARRLARPGIRPGESRRAARAARGTCRVPSPGIDGIAFNTQRPLFRDARMRRAASYALDRRALAAVYAEPPTDRLVPVAIGGSGGEHRLSGRTRSGQRRAGSPAPGRTARRPSTSAAIPTSRRIAEIVRANLAEIGIDVHFNASLQCLTGPRAEADRSGGHPARVAPRRRARSRAVRRVRVRRGRYSAPGYWRQRASARPARQRPRDARQPLA